MNTVIAILLTRSKRQLSRVSQVCLAKILFLTLNSSASGSKFLTYTYSPQIVLTSRKKAPNILKVAHLPPA